MSGIRKQTFRGRGFTRVECAAVVVAVVAVLGVAQAMISVPRGVMTQTNCAWHLNQVQTGLAQYVADHAGWFPTNVTDEGVPGSLWNESAWDVPKRNLWFYNIAPAYVDPNVLVCPNDPFGDLFDFEAELDGVPHSNTNVPSCGYGLNYLLRHASLMNAERTPPRTPSATILLAEVGPDDVLETVPLYASVDPSGTGQPWRDGGRVIWDDGQRGWYNGPTWLTTRHGKGINMGAFDGSVRTVNAAAALARPLQDRYVDCLQYDRLTHTYTCALCVIGTPHHTFYEDGLWWWTGEIPDPYGAPAAASTQSATLERDAPASVILR